MLDIFGSLQSELIKYFLVLFLAHRMISTPLLPQKPSESIYQPSEDSYLLLDALEADLSLIQSIKPVIMVEIGSGSGIALSFLPQCVYRIGIDINPECCIYSNKTLKMNNRIGDCLNMDLSGGLRVKADIILFNPPYVLTESKEITTKGISQSWAGGVNGREVIDRFLPLVDSILSPNGLFYMIVVNENGIDDIKSIMLKRNFKMDIVLYRVSGWEGLSCLRFSRL